MGHDPRPDSKRLINLFIRNSDPAFGAVADAFAKVSIKTEPDLKRTSSSAFGKADGPPPVKASSKPKPYGAGTLKPAGGCLFPTAMDSHFDFWPADKEKNRYVDKYNGGQAIVFVHGTSTGKRGGCAIDFGPNSDPLMFRLESKGPTGQKNPPTQERALIRAVLAALDCFAWEDEQEEIMVVCDSTSFVLDACEHSREWIDNDWQTADDKPVANADLWIALLTRMNNLKSGGTNTAVWYSAVDRGDRARRAAGRALELAGNADYTRVLMN
ncbi:hypothetical protein MBLNU457_4751t1 [Dothideomycetes sp. NU457]